MRQWIAQKLAAASGWIGGSTNPAYESAKVTKLNDHWQPSNTSGNAALGDSWEMMTARVRDLARNDPVMRKALQMNVTLVIGAGIQSYSEAIDESGEYFNDFAIECDEAFDEWALHEADITGRMSFADMQQLSWKETVTTGFSGWLKVITADSDRVSPLAYQLFEYEQLDRTRDRPAAQGRARIVNGIELNRYNRPVAVYLYDAHPYDVQLASALRSFRIPIERVILNCIPDRISSNVGEAWMSCVVRTLKDRDKYVANELTTRALRALMTLFVYRDNPGTDLTDALNAEDTDTGQTPVEMGYPAIVELPIDAKTEIQQAGEGAKDSTAFVDLLTDLSAMGTGFSKHRLTGKASEANMASIRAGHFDDERVVSPLQNHQINKIVRPIRREWTKTHALLGLFNTITPTEFRANKSLFQKISAIAAGDPDFQPKDDGEAAIDRMRSGRSTPQYEIGRLGFHWRKHLRDVKQYLDELKRIGLGYPDWSKGAGAGYLPFVALEEQPALQKTNSQNQGQESSDGVSSRED